ARYTWNNNRDDEANIQGRLDRALVTSPWLDFFPTYTVTHCPSSISDHLAIVVNTAPTARLRRRRKVVRRFEEKWATLPACEEVIWGSWQ
ncbi:pentatricopeptide repeat-containing protein At1g08070, chloroplastic-like, partial [Fagus crenata]